MLTVWWLTVMQSRYVSYMHVLLAYLPFAIIVGLLTAAFLCS